MKSMHVGVPLHRALRWTPAVLAGLTGTAQTLGGGLPATEELSALDGSNGFIMQGVGIDTQAGRSVSSAGDINGDGFGDVIVGAPNTGYKGAGSGVAYVVFGAADFGTSSPVALGALDGTDGFAINGVADYDGAGVAVSPAGDFNDDGFDDIVVTAPFADGGIGRAYIVYGGAGVGGTGSLELSSLDGTNGFQIIPSADGLGQSAGTGDFNDDGVSDVIIGAEFVDNGVSYVVFGGLGSGATGSFSLEDPDGVTAFAINGIGLGDRAGGSVAGAGDVNGDGVEDMVIGAENASPTGPDLGQAYVVFGIAGPRAPLFELSSLDGANGFAIDGPEEYSSSGMVASGAGDVNGDGFGDVLVGFPVVSAYGDYPNSGQSYVVYGGPGVGAGGIVDLGFINGTNGFYVVGVAANDRSGNAVSSAGDVNDDGFDDLLIGAANAAPGEGQAYVIYGGTLINGGSAELNASLLDGSNGIVYNGVASGDDAGGAVAAAGDVNGDSVDDLIVGAPFADPAGPFSNSGEAYVVFGAAAFSGVIYVDAGADPGGDGTSWDTAFDTLQDGLAEAVAQDGADVEIRVAKGEYRPDEGGSQTPDDRAATFTIPEFTWVNGGWDAATDMQDLVANTTVLSGDLNEDDGQGGFTDNAYHVVTMDALDNKLSGCVVRGGIADGGGADSSGAGINCLSGEPTIADCLIRDNFATFDGGGIAVAFGTFATIERCVVRNNQADFGGGLFGINFGGEVLNCEFIDNVASSEGGAVSMAQLPGAQPQGGASPNFVNSIFMTNVSDGKGGAVSVTTSNAPNFINCLVMGNEATVSGGGFYIEDFIGGAGIDNSIVRGNEAPSGDEIDAPAEQPTVSYSNIEGGWQGPGSNNIDVDPLFRDRYGPDGILLTGDEDFTLMPTSPCIDAGDSGAYGGSFDFEDLNGAPRFVDDPNVINTGQGGGKVPEVIDIGPYEQQGLYSVWTSEAGGNYEDGFNWTNGVPFTSEAVFELDATYTVFAGGVSTDRMTVLEGDVTIGIGEAPGGGVLINGSEPLTIGGADGHLATFRVDGGSVNGGVRVLEGGTFAGANQVVLDLENAGTVRLLAPLFVGGEYIQRRGAQTGSLALVQSNEGAGNVFPGGPLTLAGGLFIELADGFDPLAGAEATVAIYGQRFGQFDVIYYPTFDDGRFMRLLYDQVPSQAGPSTFFITTLIDTITDPIVLAPPEGFSFDGAAVGSDVGDLNGDGLPDLALAVPDPSDTVPGQVIVLFNADTPGIGWDGWEPVAVGFPVGIGPVAVAIGELDGLPGNDIASANVVDDSVTVLVNDGTGFFTQSQTVPAVLDAPRDIDIGDVDNDGDDEIGVVGLSFPGQSGAGDPGGLGLAVILTRLGAANGIGYVPADTVGVGADPRALAFGDLDSDKDLDLVSGNTGDDTISAAMFIGGGGGAANGLGGGGYDEPQSTPVGNEPVAIVLSDLDSDKDLDLASTNRGSNSVSILPNDFGGAANGGGGGAIFADAVELPVGGEPRSITALEADLDGDEDLAIVAIGAGGVPVIQLLRNDTELDQIGFAPPMDVPGSEDSLLVEQGDLDADGDEDLIAVTEQLGAGPPSDDVLVFINNQPLCDADVDGDGIVDMRDLNLVLMFYGQSVVPGTNGDGNGDGIVNISDLNAVLERFGIGCAG